MHLMRLPQCYNANLNTIITKYNRIIKKLQNYFAEKGGSLDAV